MSTTRPDPLRKQGGFAIVVAIFILVVLAALGAYIVSTSSTQSLALAKDAMNSRAAQAARAGLEWATYQVTHASAFQTSCQNPNAGYVGTTRAGYTDTTPATQSIATGALVGLEDYRVDIVCRSEPHDEAGATDRVYVLTATACTVTGGCPAAIPPSVGYVEHQQTATVREE